jgi:hypothetical protein
MAGNGGSCHPIFRTGPTIQPFLETGDPDSSSSGPPGLSAFGGILHYGRSILCMMEGKAGTGLSGRNFLLRLCRLKRGVGKWGGKSSLQPDLRIGFHSFI